MPKKKLPESDAEQSERFRRNAQALIDAGELDPTEADAAFERVVAKVAPARRRDQ